MHEAKFSNIRLIILMIEDLLTDEYFFQKY